MTQRPTQTQLNEVVAELKALYLIYGDLLLDFLHPHVGPTLKALVKSDAQQAQTLRTILGETPKRNI